jgi:hypothetical protein
VNILLKGVGKIERVVISAAIAHIRNAKAEIERLPKGGLSKKSMTELDFVCHTLDDSINHCQHLLGSESTQ